MLTTKRARAGRLVGWILITEGVLVAIIRLVTIMYVLASEAYSADRFRTPRARLLLWFVFTVALSLALVWAGSFLRREPDGAWRRLGVGGRFDLAAASLFNLVALVWAVVGMVGSPATFEGWVTWIAIGVVTLLSIVGLVLDALGDIPAS
jgi:hypothetical protein